MTKKNIKQTTAANSTVENESRPISITSIDTLKRYANGAIVELPAFAEDEPFVVRLGRPSLMTMAAQGKIPNTLMSIVTKMFFGKASDASVDLKQWHQVMEIFAEACLIEPTYQQILDAGISLTDEQYISIFNYCQSGIKGVKGLF